MTDYVVFVLAKIRIHFFGPAKIRKLAEINQTFVDIKQFVSVSAHVPGIMRDENDGNAILLI